MTTLTKEISGAEVHAERVMALMVRGHEVNLDGAVVLGPVVAEGNVDLRNGGCGPVRAGGSVTIEQGGCGPVRTDGDVSISEGGCGPVRARHVTIGRDATAAVVLAKEVTVEPGGIVQKQLPAEVPRWLATGAAFGAVLGILVGAFARRR